MRFDAASFRAQLKGDVARPNLFTCAVSFPQNDINAQTKFTFTCRSAQLPGMQIGQVQVPYFGRVIKFAGDRQFEDFPVRIINDEDYTVRQAFETWQNNLVS